VAVGILREMEIKTLTASDFINVDFLANVEAIVERGFDWLPSD
jgi:hypothetical protein